MKSTDRNKNKDGKPTSSKPSLSTQSKNAPKLIKLENEIEEPIDTSYFSSYQQIMNPRNSKRGDKSQRLEPDVLKDAQKSNKPIEDKPSANSFIDISSPTQKLSQREIIVNKVFEPKLEIKTKSKVNMCNVIIQDKINNSQASMRNTLSPKRHQNGSAMRKEGQMNSDLKTFSKQDNKYTISNRK